MIGDGCDPVRLLSGRQRSREVRWQGQSVQTDRAMRVLLAPCRGHSVRDASEFSDGKAPPASEPFGRHPEGLAVLTVLKGDDLGDRTWIVPGRLELR